MNNFNSNDVKKIIIHNGGIACLKYVREAFERLTKKNNNDDELTLTKNEIVELSGKKSGINSLKAIEQFYKSIKKQGLAHSEIIKIAKLSDPLKTLDILNAKLSDLKEILQKSNVLFINEWKNQIIRLLRNGSSVKKIDYFLKEYKNFIDKYYQGDLSQLDKFIKLLERSNADGLKNFETQYKKLTSIKYGFSTDQCVKIIAYNSSDENFQIFEENLDKLREKCSIDEISSIASCDGSRETINAFLARYGELLNSPDILLNHKQIVRISATSCGHKNIEAIIKYKDELGQLPKEYRINGEELTKLVAHSAGYKNWIQYIELVEKQAKINNQKIDKSFILSLLCHENGKKSVETYKELEASDKYNSIAEILTKKDKKMIFRKAGGDKVLEQLNIIIQDKKLKEDLNLDDKDLVQIAKSSRAGALEYIIENKDKLKRLNLQKDAFLRIAKSNPKKFDVISIAKDKIIDHKIKILKDETILKILSYENGEETLDFIINNIKKISKCKLNDDQVIRIAKNDHARSNFKAFLAYRKKLSNLFINFSLEQIVDIAAKRGAESSMKFLSKNLIMYKDKIEKYKLNAQDISNIISIRGGKKNLNEFFSLLDNKSIYQFITIKELVEICRYIKGYKSLKVLNKYFHTNNKNNQEHVFVRKDRYGGPNLSLSKQLLFKIITKEKGYKNLKSLVNHFDSLLNKGFNNNYIITIVENYVNGGKTLKYLHKNYNELQECGLGVENRIIKDYYARL